MDVPAFLTEELAYCKSITTEKDLVDTLIKKPADLVEFFELAASDPGWVVKHMPVMKGLIRWCSKAFYLNQFPHYLANQLTKTIQDHFSLFDSILFLDHPSFTQSHYPLKKGHS